MRGKSYVHTYFWSKNVTTIPQNFLYWQQQLSLSVIHVKKRRYCLRKDYFLAGLGMRIIMLSIFLIGNHYDKYNDMSEIIFQAMNNMLQGQNPYSVTYELEWGSGTFIQPFNYGPVTLIMLLPAMLLPFWYNTLWVGMYVMINVYYYLLCNYLMKKMTFDKDLQKLRPSEGDKHAKINSKEPRVN